MEYRAWLATFQHHEHAARSAYKQVGELANECAAARARIASLTRELSQWKANHQHMVERCNYLGQRVDLPVDRIPAFQRHVDEIASLRARNEQLAVQLAEAQAGNRR